MGARATRKRSLHVFGFPYKALKGAPEIKSEGRGGSAGRRARLSRARCWGFCRGIAKPFMLPAGGCSASVVSAESCWQKQAGERGVQPLGEISKSPAARARGPCSCRHPAARRASCSSPFPPAEDNETSKRCGEGKGTAWMSLLTGQTHRCPTLRHGHAWLRLSGSLRVLGIHFLTSSGSENEHRPILVWFSLVKAEPRRKFSQNITLKPS